MKRATMLATVLLASLVASATAEARLHRPGPNRAGPRSVQADQVIQWNQELLTLLQVSGAQPSTVHPTRTLAITQLAVYDAVDAVAGGSRPYLFEPRADKRASAEAAAASAARTALLALLPTQQPASDAKFQDSLTQIGSGARVNEGIRIGERAARQILAARANDGSNATPQPYTPLPGPGEYQLTPPGFLQPVFLHWAAVRPFVLPTASRFRPPPAPAVTSARYTDDFDEIKSLGELNSAARSAEQTDIGRFWGAAPVQNVWNQIAQTAGLAYGNSLAQNARMFALLDTTLADGVIALYDAKYAYHRWRPITAVRAADTDGNAATTGDPAWTPLATTALDPSYPGAHAEISQSGAAALRAFFGSDRLDFSLTNPNLPGVVRSFGSFSQAADEAAASRIYAGQHFRYDEDAGQALGEEVGVFVAENALQPEFSRFGPRHHRRAGRAAA